VRLEVEALAFGYPGRAVGHDVSFSLDAGEVLCWLGPNGGGKTTLFRTILGLLEPHGGRVRVDGEAVAGWSRGQRARVFGYVPQAQLGAFPFTVREMVLMGRTAHLGVFATPSPRDHAVAEGALAALGIDHLRDRPYTQISGGERQLALVARALAQEPRILVMDEPTANLDFGNRVRVLGHVEALGARGIAVMLSTHDPDHAFLCAHRVALLHGGRLAALGAPTDVITPAALRLLYGVEVDVVAIAGPGGRSTRVCVPARPAGGPPAGGGGAG
jgi:iron complex transport system ATP-binding protein